MQSVLYFEHKLRTPTDRLVKQPHVRSHHRRKLPNLARRELASGFRHEACAPPASRSVAPANPLAPSPSGSSLAYRAVIPRQRLPAHAVKQTLVQLHALSLQGPAETSSNLAVCVVDCRGKKFCSRGRFGLDAPLERNCGEAQRPPRIDRRRNRILRQSAKSAVVLPSHRHST